MFLFVAAERLYLTGFVGLWLLEGSSEVFGAWNWIAVEVFVNCCVELRLSEYVVQPSYCFVVVVVVDLREVD